MSRRLLASYVALALVVLVLLEIPLGVAYARSELRSLTADVERDAVAMASLSEDTLEAKRAAPTALRRLVRTYGEDTGGRALVVTAAGWILVDSGGVPVGADYSSRPEIASALAGTVATGTRASQTLGTRLLYVAVPVSSGGVVHGAVRITYPTSRIDARVNRYRLALAVIAAVVLAVAAAVGSGFARWITRPLDRLGQAAHRVAHGDLNSRAPVGGPPELRQLAATFNEMVARLDALVHSQEQFVADASHELRTPLTALRLRLENLDVAGDRERRAELDAALDEVARLAALVDGLLMLARADRAASEPEPVAVAALVNDRIAAWTALAEEQGVTLAASVAGGAQVLVTPGRLEQILDNLLANALEVAPRGTAIELTATAAVADRCELHVLDRGPGLTEEQRASAFERFWRGRSAGPGFGLGLAIVQRLLRADGGQIDLRPRPGGGLDVCLTLPSGSRL